MSFKNLSVMIKISSLIVILGLCSIGGTMFAVSMMKDLDVTLEETIQDDAGYLQLARLSRQIVDLERAIFKLAIAATDD
ncbi:MAG: hypothetical protein B7Y95_24900, partial [Rhizobiales bacterium 32-66-11]